MAVPPPVVLQPLHECARAVRVAGTVPGATVSVHVNFDQAGSGTAPGAGGIAVRTDAPLTEGAVVTATQRIANATSEPSAPAEVRAAPEPLAPRVLGPIVYGTSEVVLSRVTPGSRVQVHSAGRVIGEVDAGESLVRVPVRAVQAPVRVTAELCGREVTSRTVAAITSPGANGGYGVQKEEVDFGTFTPPSLDDLDLPPSGHFDADLSATPLRGRLFRPLPVRGRDLGPIRDRPLVVIAHGYHSEDWEWWHDEHIEPSLEGFGWLGSHLAGWGMFACSIDLAAVNANARRPEHYAPLQWLRGEVILEMVDRLLGELEPQGVVSRDRIGLIGHSVGGEGVVIARALERERRLGRVVPPYGIRGVVAVAPHSHTDVVPTHTAYLQLHSPHDSVMGPAAKSLYDPAWRPRTHAWIEGAGHDEWNTVWRERGHSGEGEIDYRHQQSIGRRIITAFLVDALDDQHAYRGLLTGLAQHPRQPEVPVRLQHESPSVVVVDDFGDGSRQLGLEPDDSPDQTRNRLGGEVVDDGLDHAKLTDHALLPFSPHDSRSLDLAWRQRGGVYETELTGLALRPSDILSLRLSQHYDEVDDGKPDETWNPKGVDLDLLVELDDGSTRAMVRVGASQTIAYPFEGPWRSNLLRTVRLPLDAFLAVEPALDPAGLQRLRLRTDLSPRGRILVGGIEFETPLVAGPSKVRMLRVHQLGSGYGPRDDYLDTEAVVALDDHPDEVFGLELRRAPGLPAAKAALHTLRAALKSGSPVRINYQPDGPTSRRIVRVIGQR